MNCYPLTQESLIHFDSHKEESHLHIYQKQSHEAYEQAGHFCNTHGFVV